MTYYYKRLDASEKLIMIGMQLFPVTSEEDEGITEEEYKTLMNEIKSYAENVQAYFEKVRAGEITLAEVPADYREEVKKTINTPVPEPPNNPYGIPDEKYDEIKQGIVDEIVTGAKENLQ